MPVTSSMGSNCPTPSAADGQPVRSRRTGLQATARRPLRTVRPRLPLPVTFRAEDSPRGLWRSLGKRVGFTPSRVRIPHPPPLVRKRETPPGPHSPGGGFEGVVSVGLWLGPEEPADSARNLQHDRIGHVLVARGHRCRRPAHHTNNCAFPNLQGQEPSCSCVPGVAEACFSYASPPQRRLPGVIVGVRLDRAAEPVCEDSARLHPELTSASRVPRFGGDPARVQ
jgi:hypothetical protein